MDGARTGEEEQVAAVTVGLLGPLDLRVGGHEVRVGGHRQQAILATLAMSPGHVVSTDRLIESVWDGSPPATARTQIAICVVGLRRALQEQPGGRQVLATVAPGYSLLVEPDQVDVGRFTDGLGAAADLAEHGNVPAAVERFAQALALWRGPALAGLCGTAVEIEAARLEEQRLTAVEKWAELCLELGRHADVLNELSSVVARFPLRELARAHLMLAQYRAGLRSDALATYRDGRRISIEEVGLELGPRPQQVHEAILRDDPALALSGPRRTDVGVIAPAQLPAEVVGFRGRRTEVAALDRLRDRPHTEEGGPSIAYLTGAPGVGKTALAVHWARSVAPDCPDGQLYVELGAQAAPIGTCLRSLGVTAETVPTDRGEQRALYRSILSTRRIVIVLDDVRSADQLQDLVAGAAGCCVVVTSRDVHPELLGGPHAVHLPLRALPEQDAIELLGTMAGEERIGAELSAARRLVAQCDRLPLALRIIGARLAARPRSSVRQLAERMADGSRRLDELRTVDHDMRACFAETCSSLTEPESVLLRGIGGQPQSQVSLATCAALLHATPDRAEDTMERLVDRGLAEQVDTGAGVPPAYRVSGLLHAYARELYERFESGRPHAARSRTPPAGRS